MTLKDYRKNIQSILKEAGFYHGEIDGKIGPQSIAAFTDLAQESEIVDPAPVATSKSLDAQGRYSGIIDINHDNTLDLGAFIAADFCAIIHKASEGLKFTDPKYAARKAAAKAAGVLWGAYHFSSGDEAKAQADHFLSIEDGSDPKVLLALDMEPSPGPDMTVSQAEAFVTRIHEKTGRYPVIYGGGGLLRDLMDGRFSAVLAKCPLWLADYRANPKTIMPTWPKWTLLQFTDGESGQQPHATPGSQGADRNSYAGSEAELRAAWPLA